MPKRFGLSQSERLKSRKQIDELFAGGKSFAVFPIRVSYQIFPQPADDIGKEISASKPPDAALQTGINTVGHRDENAAMNNARHDQPDAIPQTGRAESKQPNGDKTSLENKPPRAIIQIGVTASKRSFRRAVDRNRIKRLLREVYRLNKEELVKTAREKNMGAAVFFLYTGKDAASFAIIEAAMKTSLQRLRQKINGNT